MSAAKPTPAAKPRALADLLFSQGFGTRRDCEGLCAAGEVQVAGHTITDPAALFAPEGLVLRVSGQPWTWQATALVLLHKPVAYECSQKPSAWPSVLLLLPPALRRRGVQPVGRLDQDTTGVLLLTDDGALIHRVTSPKHHVPKVYEVRTARPVDEAQAEQLRRGVVLNDDPQPVRAEGCEITGPQSLRLTLVQGKYHQVKRMVAAVGNHCEALHRSAFGPITLGPGPDAAAASAPAAGSALAGPEGLAAGAWRFVSDAERAALLARPRPAPGPTPV